MTSPETSRTARPERPERFRHGWQLAALLLRPRPSAFEAARDLVPFPTAYALLLAADLLSLLRAETVEAPRVVASFVAPLVALAAAALVATVVRATAVPRHDRFGRPVAPLACQLAVLLGAARLLGEVAALGPLPVAVAAGVVLLVLLVLASTFQCAAQLEVSAPRALAGLALGWLLLLVAVLLLTTCAAVLTHDGPVPSGPR
ncbi:hypothetical protein RDV89_11300 [Nocardioides zeae]|uniref:Yip1 domain-containing protein n=1 Tax=Nocardioides imazamoxiresistens TaxID=3231893 RepID=A0ABU3PWT8_9ACTN|nr:hypothetical protein [Nocardioides zeae]MDT9593656.1 hypothetical protein [Nocardioides zeae]